MVPYERNQRKLENPNLIFIKYFGLVVISRTHVLVTLLCLIS